MEYTKTIKSEDGTEVEFRIKAECHSLEEMNESLSFLARTAHRFYLETATSIKNDLVFLFPTEEEAMKASEEPIAPILDRDKPGEVTIQPLREEQIEK